MSKEKSVKPKILVIEDDPDFRACLEGILAPRGFEISLTKDGREGIERYRSWKPDLIICDVVMPEADGYEVCRTLREEGVTIPFLFLTGKKRTRDVLLGYRSGADDYINKPFDGHVLFEKVKVLLARQNPLITDS